MTQSIFSNILSTIGVITGLLGFMISLYVLNKEKISLEVYHPCDLDDYVGFNAEYVGTDNICAPDYKYYPYLLTFWVQITNKSKSRTTIRKVYLKIPQCKESVLYSQTNDDFIIASEYVVNENDDIVVKSRYSYFDYIKLPIEIMPYSVVEGYLYFRDLEFIGTSPFKAILKIETSQRTIKRKITINPVHPTLIS